MPDWITARRDRQLPVPDDLADVARRLAEAFPDAGAVAPLRLLGAGFDSYAVETAGGIAFRIGRNADAAASYTMEWRLLPAIAPLLPLPVPVPRWHEPRSARFAFGAFGYPRLPGRYLRVRQLDHAAFRRAAEDLGRFLHAMHSIPPVLVAPLGVPGAETVRAHAVALRDRSRAALRHALTAGEYARVESWWASLLADETHWSYEPVVTHGDIWQENVLVADAGEISGVLDFGDVMVADPARDFATLLHFSASFASAVQRAYVAAGGRLDAALRRRVRGHWAMRPFGSIAWSARFGDVEEIADGVRKLREGPILSEGAGFESHQWMRARL